MDFCSLVPLDRLFIPPLTTFLVTILRGSVLFTSPAPGDYDTQNIRVAHTIPSTDSSLSSQWQSY